MRAGLGRSGGAPLTPHISSQHQPRVPQAPPARLLACLAACRDSQCHAGDTKQGEGWLGASSPRTGAHSDSGEGDAGMPGAGSSA